LKKLGQKYLGILLLVLMVLNSSLCVSAVGMAQEDTNSTDVVVGNDTKSSTDIIYVSMEGNDNNTGFSELESKRTIQKAIKKAVKEGKRTIIVKPGVYYENIQIPKKGTIILKGENATINGDETDPCVTLPDSSTAYLSGFTITNGFATYGGGGISNKGILTIENCTITGNQATIGGGICNYNRMELSNTSVMNNKATQNGGGVYNNNGIDMRYCTLENNSAKASGGGLYSEEPGTIFNCTFKDNNANNGGAAFLNNRYYKFTNCVFNHNSAGTNGGGIYSNYGIDMRYCTLENNSAKANGGGVYSEESGTTRNCTFKDNNANNGGAAFLNNKYKFNNCVFNHNSAGTYGGGIYSPNKKDLTIANCFFTDNIASKGGAIALKGALKYYYTSTFTNNQVPEVYTTI
jgi:predicted outer membrane repeat protein